MCVSCNVAGTHKHLLSAHLTPTLSGPHLNPTTQQLPGPHCSTHTPVHPDAAPPPPDTHKHTSALQSQTHTPPITWNCGSFRLKLRILNPPLPSPHGSGPLPLLLLLLLLGAGVIPVTSP